MPPQAASAAPPTPPAPAAEVGDFPGAPGTSDATIAPSVSISEGAGSHCEPTRENADIGPVISNGARAAVEGAVQAARGRGATLLAGGSRGEGDGWFFQPTLVSVSDPLDPFAQEETFGPAAALLVADSGDAAVTIANSTRYGLLAPYPART